MSAEEIKPKTFVGIGKNPKPILETSGRQNRPTQHHYLHKEQDKGEETVRPWKERGAQKEQETENDKIRREREPIAMKELW